MPDLAQLKAKRTIVKSKITRIETFVKSFQSSDNLIQLEIRLESITNAMKEYEDLQDQIELLDDKDPDREPIETQYFNVVTEIKSLLIKYKSPISSIVPTSSGGNNSNQVLHSDQMLKLPVLNLPSFSGSYSDWLPFHDIFQSLIHQNSSLNDVQKFHYLKSCLKDEPLATIEALTISSNNYKSAYDLLNKRYNNIRLITQEHVLAIINSPTVSKSNSSALRKLLIDISTNIEALKVQNLPVIHWDCLIVPLITEKLDYNSKREWQTTLTDQIPKLSDLIQFLEKRCELLESLQQINQKFSGNNSKPIYNHNKHLNQNYSNRNRPVVQTITNQNSHCHFCKSNSHFIFKCPTFLNLSSNDREKHITSIKACTNCLRINHNANNCKSSSTCQECHLKHNTLLHKHQPTPHVTLFASNNQINSNQIFNNQTILLATAIVKIFDNQGNSHDCRAMLDCGSQVNLISNEFCEKLRLKTSKINFPITGVGNIQTAVNKTTHVTIQSNDSSTQLNMHCLVLSKIIESFPNHSYSITNYKIPSDIILADSKFNISRQIDLLIGAEFFWNLICPAEIEIIPKQLVLRKTLLGWVVTGKIGYGYNLFSGFCASLQSKTDVDLETQIVKFWEIENQASGTLSTFSSEEKACEAHFIAHTKRDETGKFIVRLPFKSNQQSLGFSHHKAINQFYYIENKLSKNPNLKQDYHKFMEEYLNLKHMEPSNTQNILPNDQYFLPFHAVFKESSTTSKIRLVFNGSSKGSNGVSLNDILLVGPTIQQDLFSIVTRFRTHQFVISCDIVKMYRQIWVHPDDRKFQQIYWRDNANKPLETYQLKTVTYGTASAPYLAIKCLQQLGIDEKDKFPLAYPVILNDFYVDDLLSGGKTIKETIEIRDQIIGVLSQGGFQLQKFASNSPEVLSNIVDISSNNSPVINLNFENEVKTLGLFWNCTDDTIKYTIKSSNTSNFTKRSVLSTIAQIYDILGLISPVMVLAKILFQKMWTLKLSWDDPLPTDLHKLWSEFSDQLKFLNNVTIPRKVVADSHDFVELHGFCDASLSAYGACIYIRTFDKNLNVYKINLLCARSRVAPVKTITLPRLELCAAVLLARIIYKLLPTLNLNIRKICLWTDSSIVLSWLVSPANSWKVFVANRVSEIQTLTKNYTWRHVTSENNPADIVSRGISPNKIMHCHLWWQGPEFLSKAELQWPITNINLINNSEYENEKRSHLTALPISNNIPPEPPFLTKYSSFTKLQRVIAYCFRFIQNCLNSKNKLIDHLSQTELENSTTCIIKLVQKNEFACEIKTLTHNGQITKNSKLLTLNPFLDKNQIVRVGGRLKNASINFNKKFPILLPKTHHVTKLIMLLEHKKQLHAGPTATLAAVRETYWPLAGRSVIRQIIHNCHSCFRANPKSLKELMSDLPLHRVQPSRPFLHCGIDYAGPITIKEGGRRSKKTVKSYIALFKCFATKAVHLELVNDLTTETFLNALKRFMARRGKVASIYSDNATYFTAANRELHILLKSSKFESDVIQPLVQDNIKWNFIPARSPHRGGFWEAGIAAVKFHLKRVVGTALLTYEELYTILVQIEACINSRPITLISSDPNDLSPLTPGHFLIGDKLTTSAEADLTTIKENRLSRWQRVQQITQNFWKRWSREYLHSLQQRSKWHHQGRHNIQPGLPVLLKEENLHPLCWKIGIITKVHPGKDGIIRTVTIKTTTGETVRAINRICPFPQND